MYWSLTKWTERHIRLEDHFMGIFMGKMQEKFRLKMTPNAIKLQEIGFPFQKFSGGCPQTPSRWGAYGAHNRLRRLVTPRFHQAGYGPVRHTCTYTRSVLQLPSQLYSPTQCGLCSSHFSWKQTNHWVDDRLIQRPYNQRPYTHWM